MLASVVFGIVHDSFTVSVCKEYFTVHHPPVFKTENPVLLALAWGVYATWWVGAGLGIFLAVCSTVGARPVMTAWRLVRPVVSLLAGLLAAGLAVWLFVRFGLRLFFAEAMKDAKENDILVMASALMHASSYMLGGLGGLVLGGWVVKKRYGRGL